MIVSSPKSLPFIIITGHAGSGKSTALAALEDNGFYCVDNMPVVLLPKFVDLIVDRGVDAQGYAFVMDLREKDFLNSYQRIIQDIQKQGYTFTLLFLSADTETLVQRYSQTRRHHPLYDGNDLVACIEADKKQLHEIEKEADRIVDTTKYTVHDLKAIFQKVAKDHNVEIPMRIHIMSFGFMHGIPHDADHIMDVRFLKNPYFVSKLGHLVGTSKEIKTFVLKDDQTHMFLTRYLDLLDYLVPLYEKEGKAYLTISIGCTGGRHRSVVIAREVYKHLIRTGRQVMISHRDIHRK